MLSEHPTRSRVSAGGGEGAKRLYLASCTSNNPISLPCALCDWICAALAVTFASSSPALLRFSIVFTGIASNDGLRG